MVEICTTTAQEQLSEIGARTCTLRGVLPMMFCWELIVSSCPQRVEGNVSF